MIADQSMRKNGTSSAPEFPYGSYHCALLYQMTTDRALTVYLNHRSNLNGRGFLMATEENYGDKCRFMLDCCINYRCRPLGKR
jgi:hypothetical protein